MEELKKIEEELKDLVNVDKKNWTNFYLLIKKVEEEKLYEVEGYRSFTQWVKEFCNSTKIHESIFWNRKKAGKVYESYQRVKEAKGIKVDDIKDINVSVESLIILDKINKNNESVAADLVDKVMNKEIKKKDLREVYNNIRPKKVNHNGHLKNKEIKLKEDIDVVEDNKINVSDIIAALSTSDWLEKTKEKKIFESAYHQDRYSTFKEFPVFPGTSRKSRRIDLLVCENLITENLWELNLHGIEIKVSKSDLINDMKYTEYSEFVDYLYLAIPEDLVEAAQETKPSGVGIIVVDKNRKAKVLEKAKKTDSYQKIDALTTLAIKLLN